jgi:hypothetical protein
VKIGLKHKRSKKKTKETSKICDSDLLSDVRCRRANCEGLGGDGLGGSGRRRAAECARPGRRRACGLALGRVANTRVTPTHSTAQREGPEGLPISILNCWFRVGRKAERGTYIVKPKLRRFGFTRIY